LVGREVYNFNIYISFHSWLHEFAVLPLHLDRFAAFRDHASSVHLAALPLAVVVVSLREGEVASPVLLSLLPEARVGGAVVIDHRALAVAVVLLPLSVVIVSILVLVRTFPVFFVFEPAALIAFAIAVDIRAVALLLVITPLTRVAILILNDQFA
jgi:hypothetical protein